MAKQKKRKKFKVPRLKKLAYVPLTVGFLLFCFYRKIVRLEVHKNLGIGSSPLRPFPFFSFKSFNFLIFKIFCVKLIEGIITFNFTPHLLKWNIYVSRKKDLKKVT